VFINKIANWVVGHFEIFAARVDFGSTFERISTISSTLQTWLATPVLIAGVVLSV